MSEKVWATTPPNWTATHRHREGNSLRERKLAAPPSAAAMVLFTIATPLAVESENSVTKVVSGTPPKTRT